MNLLLATVQGTGEVENITTPGNFRKEIIIWVPLWSDDNLVEN